MAKLDAVRCDECGKIVERDEATEKLTRYKGSVVNGQKITDLCADCAHEETEGVELKPWPRMKDDGDSADEG